MKKKLSRTRAKLCIVLFGIGLALLIAGYFVNGWIPTILAVIAVVAALFVRPGKCLTCGKHITPAPQWSQPGKYHCPYCGSRFVYDDEEEEA